jgi:thiol:disulfide interchange protein
VMAALAQRNVVTLRADWTRRDAAIAAEIHRLGRNGVPVYAVYRAGQAPQVLPEVLTPSILLEALGASLPR